VLHGHHGPHVCRKRGFSQKVCISAQVRQMLFVSMLNER